jgi:predicted peptidase
MRNRLLFIWCCLFFQLADAQDFSSWQAGVFTAQQGRLAYRLLLPADTVSPKPLLIFLHGAFEKGDDNLSQLNIGGRFFLRDSIRNGYPAYVLFPQCPTDDSWAYFENRIDYTTGFATDWVFPFRKEPTHISALLKTWIDSMQHIYAVDTSRIYIAGLSQGGMGVLDMLARYPGYFAAGISMCGAGDPSTTKLIAGKSAVWLFHGAADKVVPPDFSKDYYRRLKRLNSEVRLSWYEGVEHNCWVKAFAEPDLMHWLFSQRRKTSSTQ